VVERARRGAKFRATMFAGALNADLASDTRSGKAMLR
jgi:hypothetical protein